MKLHIYTNNAYDTVACIDNNKVVSQWDETAIGEALKASNPSDWDDQGLDIDIEDFEEGQELWAIIEHDGTLIKPDDALFDSRYNFHFRG